VNLSLVRFREGKCFTSANPRLGHAVPSGDATSGWITSRIRDAEGELHACILRLADQAAVFEGVREGLIFVCHVIPDMANEDQPFAHTFEDCRLICQTQNTCVQFAFREGKCFTRPQSPKSGFRHNPFFSVISRIRLVIQPDVASPLGTACVGNLISEIEVVWSCLDIFDCSLFGGKISVLW
jgi:hypothetical protein